MAFGVLEPGESEVRGTRDGNDEPTRSSSMLVFDFGGGTLDVTIMDILGDSFKVSTCLCCLCTRAHL